MMLALTWHGKHDVRVETVDDPGIINPRDAIVRVTSSAICGMDRLIYDGLVPEFRAGDILGHEFMGQVVEVGAASTLRRGQRVVVPSLIACGGCYDCSRRNYAACENGNPPENQDISRSAFGLPIAAKFGHGRIAGGYSGGQAEYVRVPFSDTGPIEVPGDLPDDALLPLGDTLPAGWQAVEYVALVKGDTVAIWGCGPVGLFAIQAARLLDAGRIIAIDCHAHRIELARRLGAEVIHSGESCVQEALIDMTGGVGPDACIDAAGVDLYGSPFNVMADPGEPSFLPAMAPSHAVHQAILACRRGGRMAVAGCYGRSLDAFPIEALAAKGLTLSSGHADVQRLLAPLLELVQDGLIDTTFLSTRHVDLEQGADAYPDLRSARETLSRMVLRTKAYRS